MISNNQTRGVRAGLSRWLMAGAAGALIMTSAACDTDELVNLQDPDLITLPTVEDTANVELVRNGAVYEFGIAYAGPAATNQTPGIIGISGVMSDEMWYASTFGTMRDIDQRAILETNGGVATVYSNLHEARNLAEQASNLYAMTGEAGSPSHALLRNLAAYTYVLFGETFCSGVPFSEATLQGDLEYAAGIPTEEMFQRAIDRFNEAIEMAADGSEQELVAQLGKARALLDLGRFEEAATVAAQVPTDFQYDITYHSEQVYLNNGIFFEINANGRSSVASNEGTGGNSIMYFNRGSTPDGTNTIDPRAPADSAGTGLGTTTPRYAQGKYADFGSDIPLATGIEARLIEAEALIDGGASAAYLPTLNELRDLAGLAPLTDPGSADARVLQLYRERAFWLWLTGHRLGDLRRLIEFYGFTEDEVYPTGLTIRATPYGDDVNFPIPQTEENNPEYSGSCIDREA